MLPDPRTPIDDHPEQDPAEGSRETVERDLAEQENKGEAPGESKTAEKQDSAKGSS